MTLLHMDSLGLGDYTFRYTVNGSAARQTTLNRFTGVPHLRLSGSDTVARSITPSATVITGYATKSSSQLNLLGDSGATQHLTVTIFPTTIEVRRGTSSGTLLASAVHGYVATDWVYVEVKATIADAGGIVQVRMNGNTTPVINFTGDTRNGGTSTNIDVVRLGGQSQGDFADWYICNGLGSAPTNDFLGDVRVHSLRPNGNGTYSQYVGSDGNSTDNYLLTDESPYNTTDYVGNSTVGQKDSYTLDNLPAGVTAVYGIQEVAIVAKSDAGAASIKQLLRVGGTDYTTSSFVLSTSYQEMLNIRELNPNTGVAWTPAGVDGIEAGVETA